MSEKLGQDDSLALELWGGFVVLDPHLFVERTASQQGGSLTAACERSKEAG